MTLAKPLLALLAAATLTLAGTAQAMELTSPDIQSNATIGHAFVYKGFGCEGGNRSPALAWKGAPAETKSFALLVHDPDAPTGGAGWWHWLAYDIPASASSLPQGAGAPDGSAMPRGSVQHITDFGAPGWGGPCPPQGDKPHRYHFTIHALKLEKLPVQPGASAALVGFLVNANSLDKATLTGLYGR
ncbi:MAG: YbhB/YbcL family Raf kinase inhibitor-like protein [Magnetococcales bacterium]|nr:YbhB/YbcL family Raf kinase inhibitor-like protein [Magnetococcales bacterium]